MSTPILDRLLCVCCQAERAAHHLRMIQDSGCNRRAAIATAIGYLDSLARNPAPMCDKHRAVRRLLGDARV